MKVETISLSAQQGSETDSYKIVIGNRIIDSLPQLFDLSQYSKIHILYDKALESYRPSWSTDNWGPNLSSSAISAGESSKSLPIIEQIIGEFVSAHLDRHSLVINIGGGVLGDAGGFAASIFMRGIPFIQIPTTLLAQVDASIGGKVAVNFSGIKNLIGSFQQPRMVLIDTEFLKTLPAREISSGFAEIIKHGLIYDAAFLTKLETLSPSVISTAQGISVIKRNCEIKAEIVEKDPREQGLRKILNFGHTIGHAIESIMARSDTPLLHGECVALGMVAEAQIAQQRGKLSSEAVTRIDQLLKRCNLPSRLATAIDDKEALKIIRYDKKNSSQKIFCALVEELGVCSPQVQVSEQEIFTALRFLTSSQ